MIRQSLDAKEKELAQERTRTADLNHQITNLNNELKDKTNRIDVLERDFRQLEVETGKLNKDIVNLRADNSRQKNEPKVELNYLRWMSC